MSITPQQSDMLPEQERRLELLPLHRMHQAHLWTLKSEHTVQQYPAWELYPAGGDTVLVCPLPFETLPEGWEAASELFLSLGFIPNHPQLQWKPSWLRMRKKALLTSVCADSQQSPGEIKDKKQTVFSKIKTASLCLI